MSLNQYQFRMKVKGHKGVKENFFITACNVYVACLMAHCYMRLHNGYGLTFEYQCRPFPGVPQQDDVFHRDGGLYGDVKGCLWKGDIICVECVGNKLLNGGMVVYDTFKLDTSRWTYWIPNSVVREQLYSYNIQGVNELGLVREATDEQWYIIETTPCYCCNRLLIDCPR